MFLFTDIIRMIRDITREAGWVGPWGAALNIPQFIGAAVFWQETAALVIAGVNLLCLMVAGQMHKRHPFTRLTSIVHLPWLIQLPWMLTLFPAFDLWTAFHWWLAYTALTIGLSLVMDANNLRIWLSERDSTFAEQSRE